MCGYDDVVPVSHCFYLSRSCAFVAENSLRHFSSGNKLCSGDTVNPVTGQHPVKVYFLLYYYYFIFHLFYLQYCAFCKSSFFCILFLICQTKIFMVILTILCNFILKYCVLFLKVHIYYRGLIKDHIE